MSQAEPTARLARKVERLEREVADVGSSRKRLVAAADSDRRAIERALHDGVQQHLVALAVNLRRLAGLVDEDPAAAKTLLEKLALDVRQALDDTAQLAERVYPPLLEARGLASALRSAAEAAGITASVKVPAGARYPPEITAAAYWCCVEALSSAAAGTQATVSVLDAHGPLTFEVGLTADHTGERFVRVRDRVEALGGRVTVEETPDGRTRVVGSLPLTDDPSRSRPGTG